MPTIDIEDYYNYGLAMRYGGLIGLHSGIQSVLDAGKARYISLINKFAAYCSQLETLPYEKLDEFQPFWNNGFLPFLDIVSLFGLIAEERPKRYVEVGSGNSTKVAHFARKQLNLDFEIVSIDPFPRAEVDNLCDIAIRKPLQEIELSFFGNLEEGDIFFFDGSHRVLQNSDCQILFFEIIPRLNTNVLIHIHDINWPKDYPNEWCNRYYNEQYVLGAMLLYAPELFEIVFPAAYVALKIDYSRQFDSIWNREGFKEIEKHGCSFWFRKIKSNSAIKLT